MTNSTSPSLRPLTVAFLLLAGCHTSTRVAGKAGQADGEVAGKLAASGFSVPDNFVANEDAREAAPLVPSEGMNWSWDAGRTTARYGPSPSASAFSIECSANGKQLIFHRFLGARGSSAGTMSFTGNGHVASLSAATTGDTDSQAGNWQAAAPTADLVAAVTKVFAGDAPVEIAVSGSTELVTAPSPIIKQPFAACRH